MIPVVSGVRERASTTTRGSTSASDSRSTDSTRAAPGTGAGFRRTTVASTRNGASCSSRDVAIPPPPTIVTFWS